MDKKLKDYLIHFVVFFILGLLIRDAHFMLWVLLSFVWFIMEHFFHKVYTSDKLPKEIIDNIKNLMEDRPVQEMRPWFRGYKGQIKAEGKNKWITKGIYNIINSSFK